MSWTRLQAILGLALFLFPGVQGCFDGPETIKLDCESAPTHPICLEQLDASDVERPADAEAPDMEGAGGVGGGEGAVADATLPDMGQCADGSVETCELSVGNCTLGSRACVEGMWGECMPIGQSDEVCNGADDDCDGDIDEGSPGAGVACETGLPGVCTEGLTACAEGLLVCELVTPPQDELCDGVDNDCDGVADEIPTRLLEPIPTALEEGTQLQDLQLFKQGDQFVAFWVNDEMELMRSASEYIGDIFDDPQPTGVSGRFATTTRYTTLGNHIYFLSSEPLAIHKFSLEGNAVSTQLEMLDSMPIQQPSIITFNNRLLVASSNSYIMGTPDAGWSVPRQFPDSFSSDFSALFTQSTTLRAHTLLGAYESENNATLLVAASSADLSSQTIAAYRLSPDGDIEERINDLGPITIFDSRAHQHATSLVVDGYISPGLDSHIARVPSILSLSEDGVSPIQSGYIEHTRLGATSVFHVDSSSIGYISWGYSNRDIPNQEWEPNVISYLLDSGDQPTHVVEPRLISSDTNIPRGGILTKDGLIFVLDDNMFKVVAPGCSPQ